MSQKNSKSKEMKTKNQNKKDENKGSLFKALGPLVGNALISGQLFKAEAELTEADPDILCEYDIKIPASEGFNLTANIYRSKIAAENGEKLPVVMCAHPYNNHLTPALKKTPFNGPPQQYRLIPQAGKPVFSELTSWESPDPNFWVPKGYAIVNMNLPGYANSEGPPTAFSEHQGKAYYEAIEWIAKQPWCNGNVGLNGVSFLAISQYHVAACQEYGGPPPSLKAISPWEGLTDVYRDIFCYGGVPEVGFPLFWWVTEVKTAINGTEEDFIKAEGSIPTDYIKNHPFYDDCWKAKAAKLEEITLPMLVCASFSDHGLHTMGSFRAFEKASSKHKWVYTHRWGKWDAYYSHDVQEMTKNFMDVFLKDDTTNGFLQTPPVRLEVRSSLKEIHEVRYEDEWPIARTQYTKLFMRGSQQSFSLEKPDEPIEVVYSAKNGKAIFNFKFDEDTEISGYMKVRVWVEARPKKSRDPSPEDMVMFAAVNKLDHGGKSVNFYGSVGNKKDMITRGWLKVSRRELDSAESTEWHPVQKGTSEMLLKPGEIVPVDIELYPSSTFFSAGESIQLIISSDEIIPSPPYKKSAVINSGIHVLHFGGKYNSYLLVPKIPSKKDDYV
jgi:putative CocE/NonD family hydrolase